MATESTLERLQAEFDSPPEAIRAAVELLESGAPAAYICRYERAATGNMHEDRLHALEERLHFLSELEVRKAAIAEQAAAKGGLPGELAAVLEGCFDQDLLDDIYQSLRPRRRTPAMQAEEKGLGPLALAIQHRQLGELSLQEAAAQYVTQDGGLPTPEAVLEGVVLILAERIGSDPLIRARVRDELSRGLLRAKVKAPDHKSANRYQDLFEFEGQVGRIPSNRMLALRRAEREGILELELCLPQDREIEILRERFASDVESDTPLGQFLDVVFRYAWEQHLHAQCSNDVRRRMKEKADRDAVRTYARNLRSQLMAPPLGHRKVLALRASSKSAWAAMLGEDGSVLSHETLHFQNDEEKAAALGKLAELSREGQPAALAIPHGRRQGVTEQFAQELLAALGEDPPMLIPVDEAASAIHATSAAGRKAMPGVEVGVRTAISLGRRLQDPLRELLRMDFRSLGLGQTLDDVHQGMLNRALDEVVASCVGSVGTDLNTADSHSLQHVPGIDKELAKAIAEHRRKNGGFKTRAQLLEVEGMTLERLRYIAGLLTIEGGDEPLDRTTVHPDHYPVARAIAEDLGIPVEDLPGKGLREVDPDKYSGPDIDRNDVIAVIQALRHAGKDPRGRMTPASNPGVRSIDDLQVDMCLTGRVANLTEFGAFVDLGIGQDGLVHLSQIPRSRLNDPEQTMRVGEVVKVYVLHVDRDKRKISLSMMRPRHLAEGRQPTLGERMQPGRRRRGGRDQEVFSRAARAPEGRRGDRRGGRPGRSEGRPGRGGEGPRERSRPPRGPGRGAGRDRRDGGRGGTPRVYTLEPDRPLEEVKGFKGEMTSLSSLRGLLGGGGEPDRSAPRPEAASAPGDQPSTESPTPAARPPEPAQNEPPEADPTPAEKGSGEDRSKEEGSQS